MKWPEGPSWAEIQARLDSGEGDSGDGGHDLPAVEEFSNEPTLDPTQWAYFAGQLAALTLSMRRVLEAAQHAEPSQALAAQIQHVLWESQTTYYRLESWRKREDGTEGAP